MPLGLLLFFSFLLALIVFLLCLSVYFSRGLSCDYAFKFITAQSLRYDEERINTIWHPKNPQMMIFYVFYNKLASTNVSNPHYSGSIFIEKTLTIYIFLNESFYYTFSRGGIQIHPVLCIASKHNN